MQVAHVCKVQAFPQKKGQQRNDKLFLNKRPEVLLHVVCGWLMDDSITHCAKKGVWCFSFPAVFLSLFGVFYSLLGVSLSLVFSLPGLVFCSLLAFASFLLALVTSAQKSKWKHIINSAQNMMGSAGRIPAIHTCICQIDQIVRGPRRGGSLENLGMAIGRRWPIGKSFKSREVLKLWGAWTPWHERIHAQLTEWTNESMNQWISEPMNQ